MTQYLDIHAHFEGEEVTYRVIAYNENGRSESELTIEKLTVLSVPEDQLKGQISIYPNPFSDQFKLLFDESNSQSDTYSYVLTDYIGRRIKKGAVQLGQLESELNENQVSVKGLYYLQLINLKSTQQVILKIVKN